jgi:hypothetical protein
MMRLALLMVLLLAAGCQKRAPDYLFDGIDFRADTDAPRGDRRTFTTTVRDAVQNVAAAQRAGRYSATQHCVRKYGTSEIDWAPASAAAPETLALTTDGMLVMQGRCAAR